MKPLFFLLLVLLFTNCKFVQHNVEGSGNITTENRTVTSFDKIKLNGVMNVILSQTGEETVKVETDDNLQSLIIVEVVDGVLHVKMQKNSNFKKSKKMNVYVSFKEIQEVDNSLVGNLSCENTIKLEKLKYTSSAVGKSLLNIDVKNLEMNISAVGNTEIEGKAYNCSFVNSAVGNFDGGDLEIENMRLKNSAVGNTVYNAKKVEINNNAVGKTYNKNTDKPLEEL